MALGGEDSTSTENLIDSYDIDYNEEGLISLCRKLITENVRLGDKLESTGYSPISEEVEDILRSENMRLKSEKQMLIERVDSWTRDAQMLNSRIEEYRQDSQSTADSLGHVHRQLEQANQDRDDWIACHAKVFRELQDTKTIVGNQAKQIKELEEQAQSLARVVMCDQVSNDSHALFLAAIRDLASINECLGLDPDDGGAVPIIEAIEKQSAALKLARNVIGENMQAIEGTMTNPRIAAFKAALAAIDALKGE